MHRLYLTGAAALLAGTTAFAAVAKPAQVTAGVNVYAVSEQGCLYEVQAAGSVQQKGKECVFAQASAGHQHTLVLRRDGRIQGFGANSWGELGTGLAGGNYVNLVNTGYSSFSKNVRVEAGASYSMALDSSGRRYAWGAGENYRRGDDFQSPTSNPARVDSLWASLSAGYGHGLALQGDGSLWGWGFNMNGQVGNGATANVIKPVRIGTALWRSASAGVTHSLGIQEDGSLWSWGNGSTTPAQVSSAGWLSVSAGDTFSLALKADGTLWGWSQKAPTPVQLGNRHWKQVDAGEGRAVGIREDDSLLVWNGIDMATAGSVNLPTLAELSKPLVFEINEDQALTAFDFPNPLMTEGGYQVLAFESYNDTTQKSTAKLFLQLYQGQLRLKPTADSNGIYQDRLLVSNGTLKTYVPFTVKIKPVQDPLFFIGSFKDIYEGTAAAFSIKNFYLGKDYTDTHSFVKISSRMGQWKISANKDSIYMDSPYNYEAQVSDSLYATITDGIDTVSGLLVTVAVKDWTEQFAISGISYTDGVTPAASNPLNHIGPGRTIRSTLCLTNKHSTTMASVKARLRSPYGWLKITDSTTTFNNMASQGKVCSADFFEYVLPDSLPKGLNLLPFDIFVKDELTDSSALLGYGLPVPRLLGTRYDEDAFLDSHGDGDGLLEEGETAEVIASFAPAYTYANNDLWFTPRKYAVQTPASSSLQVLESGIQDDVNDTLAKEGDDFLVKRTSSAAPSLVFTLDGSWNHSFGTIPLRFAYPAVLEGPQPTPGSYQAEISFKGLEFFDGVNTAPENPTNLVGPGRKVRFHLDLAAYNLHSFYGLLRSKSPGVGVTDSLAAWNEVGSYSLSQDYFEVVLPDTLPTDGAYHFQLEGRDGLASLKNTLLDFVIPIPRIKNVLVDDDSIPDSQGDDDDVPEPGERFELWLTLANPGAVPLKSVKGTLQSRSEHVQVLNAVTLSNVLVSHTTSYSDMAAATVQASPLSDFVLDYLGSDTWQSPLQLLVGATLPSGRTIRYALPLTLNASSPVSPADLAPTVTLAASSYEATVGKAFAIPLSLTDPEGATLTVNTDALPAWLSYDKASQSLVGTPAEAASYADLYVSVSDASHTVKSALFAISVKEVIIIPADLAPTVTFSASSYEATVGKDFAINLSLADPEGATLTVNTDALPLWLSYDKASQSLVGTPAEAASYADLYVSVSDASHTVKSALFAINVKASIDSTQNPPETGLLRPRLAMSLVEISPYGFRLQATATSAVLYDAHGQLRRSYSLHNVNAFIPWGVDLQPGSYWLKAGSMSYPFSLH